MRKYSTLRIRGYGSRESTRCYNFAHYEAYNYAMRRIAYLSSAILLAACSHPKPAPPPNLAIPDSAGDISQIGAPLPTTVSKPNTAVGTKPQPCLGACNTTESCVRQSEDLLCACVQVEARHCGGDALNDNVAPLGAKQWSCQPRNPSRDRGDGCPIVMPAAKTVCSVADQTCAYDVGYCGLEIQRRVCDGKHWREGESSYSPAPQ